MKMQGTNHEDTGLIDMDTQTKICSKCKVEKEETEFYADARNKSGLTSQCKKCTGKRNDKWKRKNPEKVRGYKKTWAKNNPEKVKLNVSTWQKNNLKKVKGYIAKWKKDNRKKINAYDTVWRKNNPDKIKARNTKWKQKNPERQAASVLNWQRNNPDVYQASLKKGRAKWNAANPAKITARTARRRARKLQATPAWANDFFIEEAYKLAKLRTKVTGVKWHVDHTIPLKGKGVRGLHWEGNLQVIPAKLNMSKGNRYCPDNPHIRQSPWPQCFQ